MNLPDFSDLKLSLAETVPAELEALLDSVSCTYFATVESSGTPVVADLWLDPAFFFSDEFDLSSIKDFSSWLNDALSTRLDSPVLLNLEFLH